MAYDYDKIKQQYEALSPDKQKQFAEMNKNDSTGNFQKFMNQYNAEKNQTTNTAKSTGTTVSKNTVSNNNYWQPTEYQPNPSWTNKSNSYVNQWHGNYAYDTGTQYYEKQGWNQTYSSNTNVVNSVRDAWNAKSYEEQQELLKNNPKMQETLTKYGITNKEQWTPTWAKSSPYENQWEGQYYYDWEYYRKEWDKWQWNQGNGWDYQDNSPERMAEILRNLDDLSKSNPWLFSDYNSFYNAFIAWKGRSQEQIDTLNDYFNRMKQYNKYNNMSSDDIWAWLVNWTIPEDYLNYLKYNDPQRYAEVQEARKKGEDKIKADASIDTIGVMTWEIDEAQTSTWKVIEWLKAQWLFVDKDWNLIDDRTENYASEEELWYQKQIADINARNLDIDNTVKHTYDDLVERYPWASKATLMAMAQDMNSDLLREKENNLVQLTKLQGYVNYMQQEREDRTQIWKDSISQLQKEYGMYYDYSPEWMSELAQAQYAATNVTLDQADNGTDTQKQMALDSVLSDYYDKYWSIIQRSKSQVINDVMAYAKKNGVSLSQALEDNFLKFLRQKPEFATLSSWRTITDGWTDKWSVEKIKDADWNEYSVMVNQATWEIRDMSWNSFSWSSTVWSTAKTGYWKEYTVVSSEQLVNWLSDFLEGYEIWDKWWQCWTFVNKWLQEIWVGKVYDNSKESKLNSKNEEADATAQTGWVAIWNPDKLTWDGNKYGHVGWVIKDNWDWTVTVLDSNWTKNPKTWKYDETVWMHTVNKSSLYGYFNPSKWTTTSENWDLYYAKVLSWIPTQLRNTDVEKQWYIDIAKEQKEKGLTPFEAAMSIIWFDITNKSQEAQDVKNKVLSVVRAQWEDTMFNSAVLSSIAEDINSSNYEWALRTLENQLWKYMSEKLKTNFSRDWLTSAMQAISDFDQWNTNWAAWTWNNLSSYIWWDWAKTIKFNSNLSNLSSAMRSLWYTDDEIERLLPKLTYNKANFKTSIDEIQKNILNRYNAQRNNHWMPSESRASLLWSIPLSSVYGLNAEMEAINSI